MIIVENLTKYFGDTCAVDNLNFEIKKGEVLGLLGPNGAGKTTTMRILTCYLKPDSGDIKVKNYHIQDSPVEIKKLIGYLPESAPIYPDMLVYDYLKFVADIRDIEKSRQEARIRELAEMCGTSEVMHKPVGELSKGYKQRVGLAHAMMNDPEILVLDEPTSGLDPNQIVEIREIIRKIGREKTVILSTHILSEAEATCDRIVIINRGKIAADGSTDELKREAGSDYVLNISLLHDNFNDIREAFRSMPEVTDIIHTGTENGATEFHVVCNSDKDIRPAVYEIIKNTSWPLLEFQRTTRTLETIFRELTQES
jgi:ABC-2 type transport system ATP-binding protein